MPSSAPISQCGRTPSDARGVPHCAHDAVRLLAAIGHVGERDVGNLEEYAAELLSHAGELPLEPRDLVAERAPSARSGRRRPLLAFLRRATSCEAALRAAFRSSTAWMRRRRSRSSASARSIRGPSASSARVAASPRAASSRSSAQHSEVVHGQYFGIAVGERDGSRSSASHDDTRWYAARAEVDAVATILVVSRRSRRCSTPNARVALVDCDRTTSTSPALIDQRMSRRRSRSPAPA